MRLLALEGMDDAMLLLRRWDDRARAVKSAEKRTISYSIRAQNSRFMRDAVAAPLRSLRCFPNSCGGSHGLPLVQIFLMKRS